MPPLEGEQLRYSQPGRCEQPEHQAMPRVYEGKEGSELLEGQRADVLAVVIQARLTDRERRLSLASGASDRRRLPGAFEIAWLGIRRGLDIA
jgi:hypothetical protein